MLPDRNNPPHKLPDDARSWWPLLVDELAGRDTLARVTGHRLAIYCQLLAQYYRVTDALNEKGQVVEIVGKDGEIKNQIVAAEAVQQAKLVEALRRFDKEFGFLLDLKTEDPLAALREKLTARLAGRPATRQ